MSAEEPTVSRYEIYLCELCIKGVGGECHTPGCALFLSRAPDLRLDDNPMVMLIEEKRA